MTDAAKEKSIEYIQEFDTLRAIAAFAVMVAHFSGDISYLTLRLGWPGVILFFCLSGYLITGILLRCRELSTSQSSVSTVIRFYLRRALRIFPLYYLAIFLFCLISPPIRGNLFWFLGYAVNIGKAIGYSGFEPLNHFWTLAVEEQFYIFWPFVILLLPRKFHVPVCGSLVGSALLCRILLYTSLEASPTAIQQVTFSCTDALGLGAFFAVAKQDQACLEKQLNRLAVRMLAFGYPLASLLFVFGSDNLLLLLAPLAYSLAFAPSIYLVAKHSGTNHLGPLRIAPVVLLGKISYGIYVWHLPVMWVHSKLLHKVFGYDPISQMPSNVGLATRFTLLVLLTLIVSYTSWILFEKPINRIKSKFPYRAI